MYVVITSIPRPIRMPGTSPPKKRSRMDRLVAAPVRIIGMLGGMMMPIVEAVALTAPANWDLYPCFCMAGIRMEPRAEQSATDEPEMPPMIMLETTVTLASPPRRWPTSARARLMMRWARPPAPIRFPASMKNGMATKGKESTLVNIR